MTKFYQNLESESSIVLAMNQAQLWLRDRKIGELLKWSENNLGEELNEKIVNFFNPDDFDNEERFYSDKPYLWGSFAPMG